MPSALLLLLPVASAFEVERTTSDAEVGWARFPVAYEVRTDGRLKGAALESVHQAFLTWSRVDGSDVAFEGTENPGGPRAAGYDDTHTVFVDSSWPYGDQVLAYAATWADEATGEMVHFDLAINGRLDWAEEGDDDDDVHDLRSAVLHEIGHALGLGHSEVPDAVMYAELDRGVVRRTLHEDDVDAVTYRYPYGAYTLDESDDGSAPFDALPVACQVGPTGAAWALPLLPLLAFRRRSAR